MLYSWDRLNKIGPIKNNRLSVQIENVRSIRPSTGLKPKYFQTILGRKAKQNILFGSPLSMDMVEGS